MFIEKLVGLKYSLKLNDFASTLACGVDENGNKIMCDYYQVVEIGDDLAISFGSNLNVPHSKYICTDFSVTDKNNLASHKSLEKVTEQWTDFLLLNFGEQYSTAYLNNKISNSPQV